MNLDSVHRLLRAEIDHHPLRMRIFGLSGEMGIEIRIAFPKRIVIAVGDSWITVVVRLIDGVSTSRQMIAVGDVDRFTQRIVRRPISTLMNRITPRAARVPMPGVAGKLGAQPVRQRPKASWEHFVNVFVGEHSSAFAFLVTVNARAEHSCRLALVYGMICGDNSGDYKRLLAAARCRRQC